MAFRSFVTASLILIGSVASSASQERVVVRPDVIADINLALSKQMFVATPDGPALK